MKRRPFAGAATAGCRIRLSALPPQLRFVKVRYLGETVVLLNTRLSQSAVMAALAEALDAALPTDRRSGMVAG